MSDNLAKKISFDNEKLSSKIDHNELKSLFHMLNGRPDSVMKVFTRNVNIDVDDILHLKDLVDCKLRQYKVVGKVECVSVRFSNNSFKEFNDWVQFRDMVRIDSHPIENITLIWDFMLNMESYAIPQRHTVAVRLSSAMKPSQMIQMILSGNIEDMDAIDKNAFPVMCKVDCINNMIGEEIIKIVSEGNERLSKCINDDKKFIFFRKHRILIANIVKYSFYFTSLFILSAFLCKYIDILGISKLIDINIRHVKSILMLMPFMCIFVELLKRIGVHFAEKVNESFYNYGEYHTFSITKGDKNKQDKIKSENNKNKKTALGLSCTIILNIIISTIASYIANLLVSN